MSMSGEANTTAPIRLGRRGALPGVNLPQRLHRQHGADRVRDDMDAAGGRARHQAGEHLLERVARPHRALTVVDVFGKLRPRRPGERHGLAAKADTVGDARGVEHRCLEARVVAVDVDAARRARAPGGPNRSPICGAGSIASSCQSPSPTAAEREAAFARRRHSCACDAHLGALAPEPRLSRAPFTGLRVVATSRVGLAESSAASGPGRRRATATRSRQAAPQRQRRRRRGEPAQHGAPRRRGFNGFTSRRDNMRRPHRQQRVGARTRQ